MRAKLKISKGSNAGKIFEVNVPQFVIGRAPDSDLLLRVRTAGQAPEIDGQVILNDGTAEPGTFVTAEVTEAHPYDLVARIV